MKIMNIESTNFNLKQDIKTTKSGSGNNSSTSFADELKEEALKNTKTESVEETPQEEELKPVKEETEEPVEESTQENSLPIEKDKEENPKENMELDNAINGLNSIVEEFNQSDDKLSGIIKNEDNIADNNYMINNEYNIQENKDILPQMNPNMNFSSNGQPFSSFMNDESEQNKNSNGYLGASAQDLAEEAAILSTMAENIAIANKNQALKDSRIIANEDGIKKVNSHTGIKIENIVKFDSIIMNQADVEVFVNLVENGELSMNNLAPKATEKGVQISKTLADMLAKSMETNQPVRINFDNDISIIIKVSREGRISAHFLPGSDIAENYLRNNLSSLVQRFEEENIPYDELTHHKQKRDNEEQQNKKDKK